MSTVVLMKNQLHKKKISVTYPNNPHIIVQQCSVSKSNDSNDQIKEDMSEEMEK